MWWLINEKDKLKHILAGIIISQILVIIISLFTTSIIFPIILSTLISSIVAYGKELLFDKALGLGVYNIKDFIASEVGVCYGILISILFLLL